MKHLQEYREIIPWFEGYVRRNVKELAGIRSPPLCVYVRGTTALPMWRTMC